MRFGNVLYEFFCAWGKSVNIAHVHWELSDDYGFVVRLMEIMDCTISSCNLMNDMNECRCRYGCIAWTCNRLDLPNRDFFHFIC